MKFRFSFIFIFTILSSTGSQAYQLSLNCDKNGNLISFENTSTKMTQGQASCLKTAISRLNQPSFCRNSSQVTTSLPLKTIELRAEFRSRVLIKQSKLYDREKLRELIVLALSKGADPYLVLSVVLMENPPILDSNKFSNNKVYEMLYGLIPLDAIAGVGVMGCKVARSPKELGKKSLTTPEEIAAFKKMSASKKVFDPFPPEYQQLLSQDPIKFDQLECFSRSPKCIGIIESSVKMNSLNLPGKGPAEVSFACVDNKLLGGSSFHAKILRSPESEKCCMKIETHGQEETQLQQEFLNSVAIRFLTESTKRKIISENPGVELAKQIQGFNGRGKVGVSEINKSNCYSGMDMSVTPIYGAQAGDIMLNMLMSNPEIQKMVEAEKSKLGVPVRSILCRSGEDRHRVIETQELVTLQQDYTKSKTFCKLPGVDFKPNDD